VAEKHPLVSVIIPTYNRERLVCEAAASVLAQSFQDFELIIADDGSTDNTEKNLERYTEKYTRATRPRGPVPRPLHGPVYEPVYLKLRHSGMPGLVRNKGSQAARGRYLAFLDSDDLWLPQKLELQMRLLQTDTGNPLLCHTREKWLRAGKEISQAGQKHRREGDIFADALVKCVIGPSTLVVEKAFFENHGGFREDLEIAEDYELWLRMSFTQPVLYVDKALTIKRAAVRGPDEEDNLSAKYGHIEIFRIKALRDLIDKGFFSSRTENHTENYAKNHAENYEENHTKNHTENYAKKEKLAREELARKCGIYAAGCRKRGKTAEAAEYEKLILLYSRNP
jgi:glycosyltransferase involved in cell wall biosynthesis